ncbi:hypothetical protein ACIHFD_19255 [Nonomuraea sp. NPDC051941]
MDAALVEPGTVFTPMSARTWLGAVRRRKRQLVAVTCRYDVHD